MKLIVVSVFIFCLAIFSPRASASVATFGNSTQNVAFTGIGGNAQGQGQSNVIWGACAYDGQNTKCTVSSPYTGVGPGGTITLLITYPGTGPAPLTATSISPGNDLINLSLTAGSFVVTLTETDGTIVSFYQSPSWNFIFANSSCTGVASCAVGQVGLTQGATITGPIHGSFDTTPMIRASQGVIRAGAYGAFNALAPGTWMEIYGMNLATVPLQQWSGADFHNNLAPSALGGTTVTIGGPAAFIDFVSPGQMNAQVPSNVALGPQPVVVTTAGGSSIATMITVNATEPGILAPPAFRLSAGQYVAALFPNGTTYVLPPGAIPGLPAARAKPGDTIILYVWGGLWFGDAG